MLGTASILINSTSVAGDFVSEPLKDPQGDGYQLIQSLLAIGSEGRSDRGSTSTQKLQYLPIQSTDFIFAVLPRFGLVAPSAVAVPDVDRLPGPAGLPSQQPSPPGGHWLCHALGGAISDEHCQPERCPPPACRCH